MRILNENVGYNSNREMVFAEDEDDALNQLEEQLKEQGIAHGMCMAEEV